MLFQSHEEGCTPLKPCKHCRASSFLRAELGAQKFEQFLGIYELRTEDTPDSLSPLSRPVSELEFSVRTVSCLRDHNIVTVRDLIQKTDQDLLRIPNFGRKSLNEVKAVLGSMHLRLADSP